MKRGRALLGLQGDAGRRKGRIASKGRTRIRHGNGNINVWGSKGGVGQIRSKDDLGTKDRERCRKRPLFWSRDKHKGGGGLLYI